MRTRPDWFYLGSALWFVFLWSLPSPPDAPFSSLVDAACVVMAVVMLVAFIITWLRRET